MASTVKAVGRSGYVLRVTLKDTVETIYSHSSKHGLVFLLQGAQTQRRQVMMQLGTHSN